MDIYSEKKAVKDLNSLYAEAVYGKPKAAASDSSAPKKMIVTRADKKANTKAYQNYKAGAKGYEAADHLKNEEYGELYSTVYSEDEKYGYDKDGNSLNPVDIEKKKKKDNDLAGAPKVKKEGYQRDPEQQEKERKTSKQTDPSKAGFTGIGDSIEDIMKQNAAMKKAAAKKTKKEGFSSWRDDLTEVLSATETEAEKEVKETKVKNKVVIDPEVKLEQVLGGKVETIEEDNDTKIKEEILWDRVAQALSELGEMYDVQFKVEGYQRNPEKGEKEDKRSEKQKRMDSPDKGINSPAFKKFMRDNGYG